MAFNAGLQSEPPLLAPPVRCEENSPVAIQPATPSYRAYQLLAAVTIFLGSFLLFQIQPIIAKQILPWFGGAAAIWTTCLLFFQVLLFFGYLYGHVLLSHLPERRQRFLHIALMIASLAVLPAIPAVWWKPTGGEDPIPRILALLAVTIGLPYFLISSTSPLVQGWLARIAGAGLPYRFYALSNVAALLALLGYPVIVEPSLAAHTQAMVWSALYGGFVLLCGLCTWLAPSASPAATPAASSAPAERPTSRQRNCWLLLAAFPTILSLSVTNHLSQNVAAIPFLWILPLSVYLLSLILCFESDGWYRRKIFLPLFGVMTLAAAWILLHETPNAWVKIIIPFFTLFLFVACMLFHGELARRKPGAAGLSSYYLMLSLGGAIGALLVAIGAPYVLSGNYELPIAIAVSAVAVLFFEYRRHWISDIAWTVVAVAAVAASATVVRSMKASAIVSSRNFYGGLRIVQDANSRSMVHGMVSHGTQFLDAARAHTPTTYYAPGSGVERAIESMRRPGQRVGVIGLGAGTLAAYGHPGDFYRFYEINPTVIDLARQYFTYLSDSPATIETALGDGRLTLERESPQGFDVLVVDAFSGDSIPVHLLSRESFEVYFRHLKPDGVLALHVSNSALNLVPVAARVAEASGRAAIHVHALPDDKIGRSESDWVLVALPSTFAARPSLAAAGTKPQIPPGFPVWTDDRSNLFQVLK
jgi:SAM-dependent methyltransferase